LRIIILFFDNKNYDTIPKNAEKTGKKGKNTLSVPLKIRIMLIKEELKLDWDQFRIMLKIGG